MQILDTVDFDVARRIAERVWCEQPLLQCQSQADFVQGVLDSIPDNARQIVGLVDGRLAASATLVPEHDDHVGPCLSVQWNYCMPEFRGMGWWRSLYRILIRDAAANKWAVAYTKCVGYGQYLLTYKTYQQVLEQEQRFWAKQLNR